MAIVAGAPARLIRYRDEPRHAGVAGERTNVAVG
jgi:hypothetical protein